jgi:hypothetical protein
VWAGRVGSGAVVAVPVRRPDLTPGQTRTRCPGLPGPGARGRRVSPRPCGVEHPALAGPAPLVNPHPWRSSGPLAFSSIELACLPAAGKAVVFGDSRPQAPLRPAPTLTRSRRATPRVGIGTAPGTGARDAPGVVLCDSTRPATCGALAVPNVEGGGRLIRQNSGSVKTTSRPGQLEPGLRLWANAVAQENSRPTRAGN